jgi:hypothetical protein
MIGSIAFIKGIRIDTRGNMCKVKSSDRDGLDLWHNRRSTHSVKRNVKKGKHSYDDEWSRGSVRIEGRTFRDIYHCKNQSQKSDHKNKLSFHHIDHEHSKPQFQALLQHQSIYGFT